MEGTLERKQKLQLGGKKVRKVLLSVKKKRKNANNKADTVSKRKGLSQQQH